MTKDQKFGSSKDQTKLIWCWLLLEGSAPAKATPFLSVIFMVGALLPTFKGESIENNFPGFISDMDKIWEGLLKIYDEEQKKIDIDKIIEDIESRT